MGGKDSWTDDQRSMREALAGIVRELNEEGLDRRDDRIVGD
jgi:hypothetical protein